MKILGWMMGILWVLGAAAGEFRSQGGAVGKTLILTEDLRFGADEDDDVYIWASASTSVTVDAQGHIYVGDGAARKVLAFDGTGKYLRTVMGPGSGPGELIQLLDFKVLNNGHAMSLEKLGGGIMARWQRLEVMKHAASGEGNLILEGPVLSPMGDRFAAFYVSHDRKAGVTHYQTALFSMDFKPLKVFTDRTGPLPDRSKFTDTGYWAKRLGENLSRFYKGFHVFNFDSEGRLYSARADQYEVTRWSRDLKTREQLYTRKYKPIPNSEEQIAAQMESLCEQIRDDPDLGEIVSDAVMRKAVELSDPPPARNPIYGLVVAGDGTLLVIHDVNLATRESKADVFTAGGDYVGALTLPDFAFVRPLAGLYLPKMTFHKNHAYTVLTDEYGDNRVVRYRVFWE